MMGFRFRKSLKIAPGVRVNLSKSGSSVSFGRRGATVNVSDRGTYVNAGIPGSGLSWREKVGNGRGGSVGIALLCILAIPVVLYLIGRIFG